MSYLSISEAARQWGISRQTVYNRLNQGELSVSKDSQGNTQIDVAEMVRVFGEPSTRQESIKQPSEEQQTISLSQEIQIERVKREAAEDRANYFHEHIRSLEAKIERLEHREDERERREQERENRLLLAIEHISKNHIEPPKPMAEKTKVFGQTILDRILGKAT